MIINEELKNLNIDILAKIGIKKATINKLHRLKLKKVGDIATIEITKLEQLLIEDGAIKVEQLEKILSGDLIAFTQKVFTCLKEDPSYEIVLLHANNHTHQEIAQRFSSSKEKVKEKINKFFQNLFTLVDALGNKLIANKPYIGIEELEALFTSEEDYRLLLLAFKAHATKWTYHNEAECFTVVKIQNKN